MVDLLFIIHIITAVVLLLVSVTYLVEFSYRHQNYSKIYKDNSNAKNDIDQKYKNLRIGKAADGAYYAGCYKWQNKKCKSLSSNNAYKENCQFIYDQIKNIASDPVNQNQFILSVGGGGSGGGDGDSGGNDEDEDGDSEHPVENLDKYYYCTNEWYKWSASRFIPAILTIFLAIVEILCALEKVDVIKGLTYGFLVRIILFVAFGLDVLGVSGDLGISAGIILLVLTLVWVICFIVGAIDSNKIGVK
jgi:hypothetical protein